MAFISYAQNFEDVMLWRALKHVENGFYIDVGAWSPEQDSVTKAFYDKGWRGINIEPNQNYLKLYEERRQRDINLCVALSDEEGEAEMYVVSNSGLSSLDKNIACEHRALGYENIPEVVSVKTLKSVCEQYCDETEIHFLKVDVEGLERCVLSGSDWFRFRPWIVVVEATKPMSQEETHMEWENILCNAKYNLVYKDGLNRFYLALEREALASFFKYPPNVFDDFKLSSEIEALKRTREAEEKIEASEAKVTLAELKQKIAQLDSEKSEIKLLHAQETKALAVNQEKANFNILKQCFDSVVVERNRVATERGQIVAERDQAVVERDQAVLETGIAASEISEIASERDQVLHEHNNTVRELLLTQHKRDFEVSLKNVSLGLAAELRKELIFAQHKTIKYFFHLISKKIDALVRGVCLAKVGYPLISSQRATFEVLCRSPLFDEIYYANEYPDVLVKTKHALVSHYMNYGVYESRNPCAYFDTDFYLYENPDVLASGYNPLYHYIRWGWQEARKPCARFDTKFYLTNNVDVASSGMNPLLHFTLFGLSEKRSALPYSKPSTAITEVEMLCIDKTSLRRGVSRRITTGSYKVNSSKKSILEKWFYE